MNFIYFVLRSAMGEMRSDSAGSWDNVDMRMPLSYYRYVMDRLIAR